MNKYNIIGGSGFVGSKLISLLGVNKCYNLDKNISPFFKEITKKGDIRNKEQIKLSSDSKFVILLAAEHRDDVSPSSLYYDVNVTALENKGEIDLGDPEQVPDGEVVEPFDIEGQLVWNGDVPVLQFDFDIEQEVTSEEFEGVTVLVLAKGTFIASGEILEIKRPELFIEPEDEGGISLSWESGDYILESSSEPAFINPEIIELDKGRTEYVTKPSLDHLQRFFRLRPLQ